MPPIDMRLPNENQSRMRSGKKPMSEDEAAKFLADADSVQVVTVDEPSENPDAFIEALNSRQAEIDAFTETPATEPGNEDSATTETLSNE